MNIRFNYQIWARISYEKLTLYWEQSRFYILQLQAWQNWMTVKINHCTYVWIQIALFPRYALNSNSHYVDLTWVRLWCNRENSYQFFVIMFVIISVVLLLIIGFLHYIQYYEKWEKKFNPLDELPGPRKFPLIGNIWIFAFVARSSKYTCFFIVHEL